MWGHAGGAAGTVPALATVSPLCQALCIWSLCPVWGRALWGQQRGQWGNGPEDMNSAHGKAAELGGKGGEIVDTHGECESCVSYTRAFIHFTSHTRMQTSVCVYTL